MANDKKRRGLRRLDEASITKHFDNQYGMDIETTGLGGLDSRQNKVVQIGIQQPGGVSYELNILQKKHQLSKFHEGPDRLASYYKGAGINLERQMPFTQMGSTGEEYIATVIARDEAKQVAQNLTKFGNSGVNLIIHNAQYEIRHLNRLFEGNSPFDYSDEYKNTIIENKLARAEDVKAFKAGKISAAEVRAKDISRQTRVYEQIVRDARSGGKIIDTMEIAKTANALAQKKGLIPATGDLALGTNVNFLADVFLGETERHIAIQDVKQQNKLAPHLVRLTEKLNRDNFSASMLTKKEQKWVANWNKNSLHMKVDSTKRAIQQAVDTIESGATYKFSSGRMATRDINEVVSYLSRTGKFASKLSQGDRVIDYGLSQKKIVEKAIGSMDKSYSAILKGAGVSAEGSRALPKMKGKRGWAIGGAALAMTGIAGAISGDDEDYNTIEGLRHGWFGKSRKYLTDFGSGYQKKDYSVVQREEGSKTRWGALAATGGISTAGALAFGRTTNINTNSLSYMGQAPQGFKDMASFLGRDKATYGDVLYSMVRRGEYAMGGFPKAFSVSTYMSQHIYKDAVHSVDLTKKSSALYSNYLNKLTGVDLLREGITGVEYNRGKLLASAGKQKGRVLLEQARLIQAIHDPNITKSKAQFAKSWESIMGSAGVGREHELLIAGGTSKLNAGFRNAHAYAHETLSKYLRLVDDPAGAIRDMVPDVDSGFIKTIKKATRYLPQMGVGGEKNLIGTVPQLLGRHAMKALPVLIGLPALVGTVDWAVRQVSPEDTVTGRAGLTGAVAEVGRAAHTAYAYTSDMMGLTGLRKSAEEQAPGMTGVSPFLGLTFSGGLTGLFAGAAFGLYKEIGAEASYKQLLKNKTIQKGMPALLSKLPGMTGKYARAGRWGRIGLVAGALVGAPMLLSGLGSDKSVEEVNKEYLGGKEVAIKKGRWWEFGMTPFEGSKTMYYRPNWYNRLLSQSKRKSLYGEEDISPLGKLARGLVDPYWEEKMHYEDRPYPVAGPNGEGLGILGTLYERTIGQIIKPPAYMHLDEMGGETTGGVGGGVGLAGETGEEAISPYSIKQDLKQQYYSAYEAVGLRGFFSSVVKEALTGERELFQDVALLQSSADMSSSRRDFWDLNLGGGVGLTEPIRRFIPNRPYTDEIINPLKNKMPSWMPGSEYFVDFKTGDPYTKVPEGEYRLPGAGYEERFSELKGLDPEKYPLIHQYKILADVAPYSRGLKAKQRAIQKRIDNGEYTQYEADIFSETEAQLEDRLNPRKFNPDSSYTGAFGAYTRAVADIAMKNPLEHISPISPAHKFLPAMDTLSEYEEEVFAKEFKPWEDPIGAYLKPTAHIAAKSIGIDIIPEELEDARQIQEYFDQIKYIKYKRIQDAARNEGDGRTAYQAGLKMRNTLTGADVFSDDFSPFSLPKKEREFFKALVEAPDEDKERILELVPRNTREVYMAQWTKLLESKIESGEIKGTPEELEQLQQELEDRKSRIRARRKDRQRYLEHHAENIPPADWAGWSPEVDLKDVQLKYLLTSGRDHHLYNLWEDRVRGLRRKPLAEEAAAEVDPEKPIISKAKPDEAAIIKAAGDAGLQNVSVSVGGTPGGMAMIDVQYNPEAEEDAQMRELGHVI